MRLGARFKVDSWISCQERQAMAEYDEWNRKGATLSDVTAKKEYGVDRKFIVKGIEAGKLEYREEVVWGNPSCVRTTLATIRCIVRIVCGTPRSAGCLPAACDLHDRVGFAAHIERREACVARASATQSTE